jgi:hypothetical protein
LSKIGVIFNSFAICAKELKITPNLGFHYEQNKFFLDNFDPEDGAVVRSFKTSPIVHAQQNTSLKQMKHITIVSFPL